MRSYLHDDYTKPNLNINTGDVVFHVDSEFIKHTSDTLALL